MTTDDAPAIALDAGSRRVQLAALWALGTLAAAAFAVAYPGLLWAGVELAHLPAVVAALLPIVIDAGMLTLGLAAAVKRSQRRPARLELAGLAGLVGVSVVAQVSHVLALSEPAPVVVVGCLVAAAAPLTLLLAVESALRAVLVEPPRRGAKPARRATVPANEPAAAKATKPVRPAGPRRRSPADAPAITDRQRAAAADRFDGVPGYREAIERYLLEGTPTPRAISEMPGAPAKATVQTDVRVARELVGA